MTQKELIAIVDAEAQRLGIGSSAFMERHREIMELAGSCYRLYSRLDVNWVCNIIKKAEVRMNGKSFRGIYRTMQVNGTSGEKTA